MIADSYSGLVVYRLSILLIIQQAFSLTRFLVRMASIQSDLVDHVRGAAALSTAPSAQAHAT